MKSGVGVDSPSFLALTNFMSPQPVSLLEDDLNAGFQIP